MAVRIGHAVSDERGKANSGSAGDQTGKEVYIRNWYSSSWKYVLRCKDKDKIEVMAKACEDGCNNANIGYDQYQRNTLNTQAKKVNYDLSKITTKCETDCSAFMTVCAQAAGIDVPYNSGNAPTTSTMKTAFTSTGMFEVLDDSKYLTSDKYLERGDIIVNPGKHTVMVLDNGSAVKVTSSCSSTRTKKEIIADGQNQANGFAGCGIEVDGVYGKNTKKAGIKVLQKALNLDYKSGLTVDGIWGTKTSTALGSHYVKKSETQYMVTALEILLMINGYDSKCVEAPGEFCSGLETVVKAYQKDNGLTADGIAGAKTFKALIDAS